MGRGRTSPKGARSGQKWWGCLAYTYSRGKIGCKFGVLISQPFVDRFGRYLHQNEGENGGYPPMMKLVGYEVRVIDYREIWYTIGNTWGNLGWLPIANFSTTSHTCLGSSTTANWQLWHFDSALRTTVRNFAKIFSYCPSCKYVTTDVKLQAHPRLQIRFFCLPRMERCLIIAM